MCDIGENNSYRAFSLVESVFRHLTRMSVLCYFLKYWRPFMIYMYLVSKNNYVSVTSHLRTLLPGFSNSVDSLNAPSLIYLIRYVLKVSPALKNRTVRNILCLVCFILC